MDVASEEDGFRVEAALQFGFRLAEALDGAEVYVCSEAQLLAFAKACERAGLFRARKAYRNRVLALSEVNRQIAELDAELVPILEAERRRSQEPDGK